MADRYDYIGPITVSDIPIDMMCADGFHRVGDICVRDDDSTYHDITQSDIPLPIYNVKPPALPPVVGNPVSGIEAKLKDFYTNNKGLSLLILAGAAYVLFLKDK